jgi:hypothetical protein
VDRVPCGWEILGGAGHTNGNTALASDFSIHVHLWRTNVSSGAFGALLGGGGSYLNIR